MAPRWPRTRLLAACLFVLLAAVTAQQPSPNSTTVTPVPAPTTSTPTPAPPTPSPAPVTPTPTPSPTAKPTSPPTPAPTPSSASPTTAAPMTSAPPSPSTSLTPTTPTATTATIVLPTTAADTTMPIVSACVSCSTQVPASTESHKSPSSNTNTNGKPTSQVNLQDAAQDSPNSSTAIILSAAAAVGVSVIVALVVVRQRQQRESEEIKTRAASSFALLASNRDSTIPVLYSTKRLYEPSPYAATYARAPPAPVPTATLPSAPAPINFAATYKVSDLSELSDDSSIRDTDDSRGLNAVSESFYYGSQDSVITIEEEEFDDSFESAPRRTSSIQENVVWNDSMDRELSMDSIVRESSMRRESSLVRDSSIMIGSASVDNPDWMNTARLMASDVHDL
ncbi:hypothetical protein SDRG_02354 [Saprolegnia diclina VS20]|uniref:Uncharacterized protein n=1 Tax=Saprolegnia diclina (strain VS20) TaxID=1156394 RepID=T0R2F7_SAPDV|nr:hypothetical protein SDRG_02354 [Saprolegnia diclina VS20]EQC40460.1 hypothetical protein SDRG_02354 [Saprolegnia diclina VS20]|eukprot:XP_008606159.1 hypothetical protein SDRG_02354 [Saprolegnia diclina VS20]